MKLLMISGDRSVAAGKSGAFSETLKELHQHFERIDILCPRIQAEQQVRVVHGNVYLHPATGGLVSQPSYILQKGRELYNVHHHDVMTVHEYPPFYNGIGARWLKKATGIPAVLEIHHIIGWPKASSVTEFIGRVLSTKFLPSHAQAFNAVRTVNSTVKSLLSGFGVPENKIVIVPSFYLDHELISASKNQPKTFDLVFCARLVDNKGLMPVIDAMALLPSSRLLIIGDGPLRKKAEARAQQFGSRVTFTGWLPTQADVLKSVASGKIFVMNSFSEGGPRSALEAMALGLPILATHVGVMPDVLVDGVNGMYIDGTAKDLAAKVTALQANPERIAAMGVEAEKVAQRFEKHAAVRAYADFLKSFART
ncbi:MAG: glycosyltransferase family 4 protein [Candidatus Peribacteraceae bacterium]|nr:glycosyltransferase family 4 protein [Candidatus Peribacteraceae bacterium]MBP9850850.1 glycosyltransferase family 4 protein [Candidatus Peribacteraceae bacterium]